MDKGHPVTHVTVKVLNLDNYMYELSVKIFL